MSSPEFITIPNNSVLSRKAEELIVEVLFGDIFTPEESIGSSKEYQLYGLLGTSGDLLGASQVKHNVSEWTVRKATWVETLAVAAREQRRGYGKILLANIANRALAHQDREVALCAGEIAEKYYFGLGFSYESEVSDNLVIPAPALANIAPLPSQNHSRPA